MPAAKPPPVLLEMRQNWFGSIVRQRLQEDNSIAAQAPNGAAIKEEVAKYIEPGPKLAPHERIEIYCQQYWWRFYEVLQEHFPLTSRLLSEKECKTYLAYPYIADVQPSHWSLYLLGQQLPEWVEKHYRGPEHRLISDAVHIDWAFRLASFTAHLPPVRPDDYSTPEELFAAKLYLQPHISLLATQGNLLAVRQEIIEAKEDTPPPSINTKERFHFALFRNSTLAIQWQNIPPAAYAILRLFGEGVSVEEACKKLEKSSRAIKKKAEKHLQEWLQGWISEGWLTTTPPPQ